MSDSTSGAKLLYAIAAVGMAFVLGVECGEYEPKKTEISPMEIVEISEPKMVMAQAETPVPETEAEAIARTVWGEARGCSTLQQSAVVWCILNRVDSEIYPDDIISVVHQSGQFHGYSAANPVQDDILDLVNDVLHRWRIEGECVGHVGRTLPKKYLWFAGNGTENRFRAEYRTDVFWDWSLENPYEN